MVSHNRPSRANTPPGHEAIPSHHESGSETRRSTSERLIANLLFVSPTDGVTFTAISALLAIVAMLASLLPARRAARVDPLVALRQEC
jgi:ABC-type lipoprotein release transport system permease subunit